MFCPHVVRAIDKKGKAQKVSVSVQEYFVMEEINATEAETTVPDSVEGDTAEVEIVNCNPDVKKILTISNFDQLFTIH